MGSRFIGEKTTLRLRKDPHWTPLTGEAASTALPAPPACVWRPHTQGPGRPGGSVYPLGIAKQYKSGPLLYKLPKNCSLNIYQTLNGQRQRQDSNRSSLLLTCILFPAAPADDLSSAHLPEVGGPQEASRAAGSRLTTGHQGSCPSCPSPQEMPWPLGVLLVNTLVLFLVCAELKVR